MATFVIPRGTSDLSTVSWAGLVAGDRVLFGEGSTAVTLGINAGSTINSVALNAIYFDPRYTAQVGGGTAGNLCVGVNNGTTPIVQYAAGGGSLFLESNVASGAVTTTRVKNLGQGELNLLGTGTFTGVEHKGRKTNISASTPVTNLRVSAGEVVAAYNATAFTKLWVDGGVLTTARLLATATSNCQCIIAGGAQVNVALDNTPSGTSTLPQASGTGHQMIVTDGYVNYRGGNITELIVCGNGRFDCSATPYAFTITTLRITEKAMKNSKFKSKYATITITNLEILAGDTDDLLA